MTGPRVRVTCVAAPPLPAARLARLATAALRRVTRRPVVVSLVVLDDPAIRRLNRRFLGHDYATDVLSFPLAEDPSHRGRGAGDPPRPDAAARRVSAVVPFGEVYVSAATAAREAKARGIPPAEELLRYAIHGMLHLVGYDDHRPADRRRMGSRQEALVREVQSTESGSSRRRRGGGRVVK